MPRSNASRASARESPAQRRRAAGRAKNLRRLAEERPHLREPLDRASRCPPGPLLIVSCRNGRATSANAASVRSRLRPQLALSCTATGATMIAARACEAKKRRKLVCGDGDVGQHRHAFATSGTNSCEREVEVRAAAGERVAEAAQVLLVRRSACGLSNMLKNSSNSTGFGVAFLSGIVPPSGKPCCGGALA